MISSANFKSNGKTFVPADRSSSASINSGPARLEARRRSQLSVLRGSPPQIFASTELQIQGPKAEGDAPRKNDANEEQEALPQVLECLKKATGFDSYEAYLHSLYQDPMFAGRFYDEILDECFHYHGDASSRCGVDIIDVIAESTGLLKIDVRCESLSASEASNVLCDPSPGTAAQIILWPFENHDHDSENLVDVLGLGLQLDSCFFEPLRWNETRHDDRFRSKACLYLDSIGTSVYVAKRFALAQQNSVPVVLVAGPLHTPMENFNRYSDRHSKSKAIYSLVQGAPFYDHYNSAGKPHLANTYIRVFTNMLKSARDTALTPDDAILASLVPFLKIEIAIHREDLDYWNMEFNEIKDADYLSGLPFKTKYKGQFGISRDGFLPSSRAPTFLYWFHTKLRSWNGYFENQSGTLLGLLSTQFGPYIAKESLYTPIKDESISVMRASCRLEAELRDYLQLQGSKLALEESQKSIEVSNRQITEGKRVKIFTVLAFFYVPLNLATSVFGMNLQQLNGTGTSIEAFVGTAAVALFITGMSWMLIEGTQSVRVWLSRVQDLQVQGHYRFARPERHNIAIRLYMIWWLSKNGFFKWMIRTGAGWCLLVKSSRGFRQSQPEERFLSIEDQQASEFVSWVIRRKYDYLDLLSPANGGWFLERKETLSVSEEP